MSGQNIKSLQHKVPGDQQYDFVYFLDNVYTGDFDDAEEVVFRAFYRWYDHGAVRRVDVGRDRWRIYMDVPFPKKDQFKAAFRGLWDGKYKCWYVFSPISTAGTLMSRMAAAGYHPIVIMAERTDKIQAVYNTTMAKSKFQAAEFSGAVTPATNQYMG